MEQIKLFKADDLHFDRLNPRLVEFNINSKTSEAQIMNILWTQMAVNEIVMSILAHGFFQHEAMYAVEEEGNIIIVEGNRRLAAVKAILNPELIERNGMQKYRSRITPKLIDALTTSLPVIILENREASWRYIGFKHVNGAAKWGSYAKAQYIASVHNEFGISLEDIAEQIGDANKTVIKLYQGLMLLQQADRETSFSVDDVFHKRVYFSHLYTAIGYDGFQEYLGLRGDMGNSPAVQKEKLPNLQDVMFWLFGSESKDIKPIIETQNPDLKNLNSVLQKRESVEALKTTNDLSLALDISLGGMDVLYKSLVNAKVALQKASAKVSYYKGDEDLLKIAGSVANTADVLYDNMEKIHEENIGRTKKARITD